MRTTLFFIPALAALLANALPRPVSRDVPGATIVMPGGADQLQITKYNTLNATNPAPVVAHLGNTSTSSNSSIGSNLKSRQSANSQLPLDLTNNIGGPVNAYITGLDPQGKIVFVTSNGQFYYPTADVSWNTPHLITFDVGIPLNTAQGSTTRIVLPNFISSGRIWFAQGSLSFYSLYAAGAPQMVQPSFANPSDPSASINWGFVEFTNILAGIYTNLSFVDFVGLLTSMVLTTTTGTNTVNGLQTGSINNICNSLAAQAHIDGQPWDKLCQTGGSGYLRIISPQDYVAGNPTAFSTYWNSYIDQVWNQYASNPLTINTQIGAGDVQCRTANNQLTCDGDNRAYNKPSAADIFSCNSGPFGIIQSDNAVHRAIVPRLCAAFNRATLLIANGNQQPNGPAQSSYYQQSPNNFYSKFIHQNEIDSRGYAFSYDDVAADGQPNESGLLSAGNPVSLQIIVGGVAGGSAPSSSPAPSPAPVASPSPAPVASPSPAPVSSPSPAPSSGNGQTCFGGIDCVDSPSPSPAPASQPSSPSPAPAPQPSSPSPAPAPQPSSTSPSPAPSSSPSTVPSAGQTCFGGVDCFDNSAPAPAPVANGPTAGQSCFNGEDCF